MTLPFAALFAVLALFKMCAWVGMLPELSEFDSKTEPAEQKWREFGSGLDGALPPLQPSLAHAGSQCHPIEGLPCHLCLQAHDDAVVLFPRSNERSAARAMGVRVESLAWKTAASVMH